MVFVMSVDGDDGADDVRDTILVITSVMLVVIVVNNDAGSSCIDMGGVDYDGYGFN